MIENRLEIGVDFDPSGSGYKVGMFGLNCSNIEEAKSKIVLRARGTP